MTRISWDVLTDRTFELGVDHGVVYPLAGFGVPWNGLISVNENPDAGDVESYYRDGIKFINSQDPGDFAGSIEAFNTPEAMNICIGIVSIGAGLFVGQQPKKTFTLCYRTKLGDAVVGDTLGYKLHIVYNVLLASSSKKYESQNESTSALSVSWDFTTKPVFITGARPSAHIVLDSRYIDSSIMTIIENNFYGTATTNPVSMNPSDLIALLS